MLCFEGEGVKPVAVGSFKAKKGGSLGVQQCTYCSAPASPGFERRDSYCATQPSLKLKNTEAKRKVSYFGCPLHCFPFHK